jgi:hypothetical protein
MVTSDLGAVPYNMELHLKLKDFGVECLKTERDFEAQTRGRTDGWHLK